MPDSLPAPVVGFDYSTVATKDRKALKLAAQDVRNALRRSVEEMLKVGEALVSAKSVLEHGQWEAWVLSETGMAPRTASAFIGAYERFHGRSKSAMIADLPPTAVLRLGSAPEEAIAEVEQRKKAGERLRVADVDEIIRVARHGAKEGKRAPRRDQAATAGVLVPGEAGLRALVDRARDELVPQLHERLTRLRAIIASAEAEATEKGRVGKAALQEATIEDAKWIDHVLERLSNREPGQEFVPRSRYDVLGRPQHDTEGPWDACAILVRDLSRAYAWTNEIPAKELPQLVIEWGRVLDAALGTTRPGSKPKRGTAKAGSVQATVESDEEKSPPAPEVPLPVFLRGSATGRP